MNLFVSFILRAISVFIKDGVLYTKEDSEHCFIHTVSDTNTPKLFVPGNALALNRALTLPLVVFVSP